MLTEKKYMSNYVGSFFSETSAKQMSNYVGSCLETTEKNVKLCGTVVAKLRKQGLVWI